MRKLFAQLPAVDRSAARARAALGVIALGMLLAGCGVSRGSGTIESEIFREVTLDSSFIAGEQIRVTVDYEQPYSVPVAVECDLLESDGETKVTDILSEQLPGNPEGGVAGEVTPTTGQVEQHFQAPEEPGEYVIECFTTEDDNNAVQKRITLRRPDR